MKRIVSAMIVAMAGSIGLVGCNSGSPGGPGASNRDSKDKGVHLNNPDNTFTLSVPGSIPPNHIKQGETKSYTFGVSKEKNFDQDVAISFSKLPTGVTAEPAAPVIKHGDKEVSVSFKASNEAAVGEFTVKVIGHPAKGEDTSKEFTLHVDKK